MPEPGSAVLECTSSDNQGTFAIGDVVNIAHGVGFLLFGVIGLVAILVGMVLRRRNRKPPVA